MLTVVDQDTRECLTLFANNALSGEKVAAVLDKIVILRSTRESITVDNGTEFASKAMDLWAYKNGVHLDFIRPGKPVENGHNRIVQRQAVGRVPLRGDLLHPGRRSSQAASLAAGL